MKKLYFITGSQELYGEGVLRQVAANGRVIAGYLHERLSGVAEVVWQPTVKSAEGAEAVFVNVMADAECVGAVAWMHTFSPAKMWIRGLKLLHKPLLHLHTQFNEKLPYDTIDMDFMNLNQSAHGDREFGFICARLGIRREVAAGYYKHDAVIKQVREFAEAAKAVAFSNGLRVAMFGNNMRDVAVTDGDRVESEIRFGWNVNYYGIGDLVELAAAVTEEETATKLAEYASKYKTATQDIAAVREQAKYEAALDKFLAKEKIGAFTDTFQDLHGLKQLPGLAVQNLMARGVGFGPEGDYKTAALMAALCNMAENRAGATGFMEDYTYDLTEGCELELAAHMLEVSPAFASDTPKIEVHPLGIGGKEPSARLVFSGIEGAAVAVSLVDMGTRFRLICAEIDLQKRPKPMPKLPVASLLWKLRPDFATGAAAWIYAGGAHHAVVSTALRVQDIRRFAKFTGTEFVAIDGGTVLSEFEEKLQSLNRNSSF
jgi:L-arabinose isomerase